MHAHVMNVLVVATCNGWWELRMDLKDYCVCQKQMDKLAPCLFVVIGDHSYKMFQQYNLFWNFKKLIIYWLKVNYMGTVISNPMTLYYKTTKASDSVLQNESTFWKHL